MLEGMRMKDKIIDFLLVHGFQIMLTGFSLSAVGIITYIKMQHAPGHIRELGGALVVVGIGLYLIGRIGVVAQNRRERKLRRQAAANTTEKEPM
jgi:hypothetical protein